VKRHAFDPASFVFGLLFAFLAVFVLSGNDLADLYPLWVWTLPAMAAGLLVVMYGVRRLVSSAVGGSAVGGSAEPIVAETDLAETATGDLGSAPPLD
jgi:hypothetical protein